MTLFAAPRCRRCGNVYIPDLAQSCECLCCGFNNNAASLNESASKLKGSGPQEIRKTCKCEIWYFTEHGCEKCEIGSKKKVARRSEKSGRHHAVATRAR